MRKYIDAEALLNNLPDDIPYKASVKRVLTQAPSADVVEVVRCWHCKHREKVEEPNHIWSCLCKRFRKAMEVDAEDFCSYGERRTD